MGAVMVLLLIVHPFVCPVQPEKFQELPAVAVIWAFDPLAHQPSATFTVPLPLVEVSSQ